MRFITNTIWSFLVISTTAFSVETAHSVASNYSLVGVIANGAYAKNHKGIAVVRDLNRKKSITVSTGQTLPYSGWIVTVVERDQIVIQNGEQTDVIRYQAEDDAAPVKTASKTLDSTPNEVIEKPIEKKVNVYPDSDTEWMEFYRNRMNDGEAFDSYHRENQSGETTVTVLGSTANESEEMDTDEE